MTNPLHFTDTAWAIQDARRQAIDESAEVCEKWARLLEEISKANKMAEQFGGLPVSPSTGAQAEMARTLAKMIRKLPAKAFEEQRKNIETDGASLRSSKVRHPNLPKERRNDEVVFGVAHLPASPRDV